jgi:hypothetical protein
MEGKNQYMENGFTGFLGNVIFHFFFFWIFQLFFLSMGRDSSE